MPDIGWMLLIERMLLFDIEAGIRGTCDLLYLVFLFSNLRVKRRGEEYGHGCMYG